jgi:divinyl protochlorophyllide a 8-vinyl-reductase
MPDHALPQPHVAVARPGRGGLGHAQGRIGPNAITRMDEALVALHGEARRDSVFRAAGLEHHLKTPPGDMVPDEDVAFLHLATVNALGLDAALAVSREAGRRTAAYLLANRIPGAAQPILRLLPPQWSLAVLMKAIAAHAWTFAGAGHFSHKTGREAGVAMTLTIAGGPISRYIACDEPVCAYYAATFETIIRALVSRKATVVETACEAMGAPACVFEVRLG